MYLKLIKIILNLFVLQRRCYFLVSCIFLGDFFLFFSMSLYTLQFWKSCKELLGHPWIHRESLDVIIIVKMPISHSLESSKGKPRSTSWINRIPWFVFQITMAIMYIFITNTFLWNNTNFSTYWVFLDVKKWHTDEIYRVLICQPYNLWTIPVYYNICCQLMYQNDQSLF